MEYLIGDEFHDYGFFKRLKHFGFSALDFRRAESQNQTIALTEEAGFKDPLEKGLDVALSLVKNPISGIFKALKVGVVLVVIAGVVWVVVKLWQN